MKHLMILLFTISLLNSANTDIPNSIDNNISCEAEIKVSNGRSSKSMLKSEQTFNMEIKNTSSTAKIYTLYTKQLEGDCSNKYNPRKEGESNIKLAIDIINASGGIDIQLNSGESKTFIVKVMTPNEIIYNSWACIEVNAKTSTCDTVSTPQILSVFVADPNED